MSSLTTHGTRPSRSGPASPPGLWGFVNRISHVSVNVSDLEPSVRFYERVYPLKRAERINGPVQDYPSLEISSGQFEGWVMRDKLNPSGRSINLIEWKNPRPHGTPYREGNHVGFYRMNCRASGTGLYAAYDRVIAVGGRPYGRPSSLFTQGGLPPVYAFASRDPDGVTFEFTSFIPEGSAELYDAVTHVNLNCRNLGRSFRFYHELMGLHFGRHPGFPIPRMRPGIMQPQSAGSLSDLLREPDGNVYSGEMDFDGVLLTTRGDGRNPIDLLEWKTPAPFGDPYDSPTHLGISSLAIEVERLDDCYAILAAHIEDYGGKTLGPPEAWDMDEFGIHRMMTLRDPDGAFIQLTEAPAVDPGWVP